jgi:outer membrane protein assembly factor BamB
MNSTDSTPFRSFRWLVPAVLMILTFSGGGTRAADFASDHLNQWHHWRGPHANGVAHNAHPPLRWDAQTHIKWKAQLPGKGASTPIVWKDHIIVLTAIPTERLPESPTPKDERAATHPPGVIYQFVVLNVDRATGQIRWQRVVREEAPHEGHHETHSYAAGSPTTDGQRIYVPFGSRGVYCYDLEGNLLWQRDLGRLRTRMGWGEATSLVLQDNQLIIPWEQEDQSYLFNLDPETGATRWRVERDEPSNWSTPLFLTHNGKTQVVVNGTHRARGYEPDSGRVLWECGSLSVNAIPSPIAGQGLIFCMSGYRKSVLYAIPYDARGDISDTESIAWTYDRNTPYVASPILVDGRIFMIKDRSGLITILEAATGKPLLEAERIPELRTIYASPMAADGRIYLVDREGTTVVLRYDPKLEVVAVNRLEDTIDASPVAVGRQLFLRSWSHLYCIEEN